MSRHPGQRGFTLVEMVMVIVILALASVALMDQFVNASKTYLIDEQLQTATQLAQECAEHILATRRVLGYAAISSTCPTLPPTYTTPGAVYAVTASLVDVTPLTNTACFTAPCKVVTVTTTFNTAVHAQVVFLLGSY